ncbi:MAG: DUF58 domain-containing protein [Planctomycetia bacterium]|nr:DUF58 domain-containing protein [Planctomycetia bacterium]
MPQSVTELIKKVKRLEIVSNRFANDLFAGQYKSVFRGRGMEFSEVREYQPGDDIRLIDWNVTARAGRPYIKRFVEERELTVLFVVDISASGLFGSSRSKLDAAIEVVGTLMFSALKNNDKVGLLTFGDEVKSYSRPAKGKPNILRLIRELVACQPVYGPTNIDAALQYVNRVLKRRAVVFLLSDFFAPEMSRNLAMCARRHDLIALAVSDRAERELPDVGFVRLFDPETGQTLEVDTSDSRVRHWLADDWRRRGEQLDKQLQKAKVDRLNVDTNEDPLSDLRKFFRARAKRFR